MGSAWSCCQEAPVPTRSVGAHRATRTATHHGPVASSFVSTVAPVARFAAPGRGQTSSRDENVPQDDLCPAEALHPAQVELEESELAQSPATSSRVQFSPHVLLLFSDSSESLSSPSSNPPSEPVRPYQLSESRIRDHADTEDDLRGSQTDVSAQDAPGPEANIIEFPGSAAHREEEEEEASAPIPLTVALRSRRRRSSSSSSAASPIPAPGSENPLIGDDDAAASLSSLAASLSRCTFATTELLHEALPLRSQLARRSRTSSSVASPVSPRFSVRVDDREMAQRGSREQSPRRASELVAQANTSPPQLNINLMRVDVPKLFVESASVQQQKRPRELVRRATK